MQLKQTPARLFSGGLETVPYGGPRVAINIGGQTRIRPCSHETKAPFQRESNVFTSPPHDVLMGAAPRRS